MTILSSAFVLLAILGVALGRPEWRVINGTEPQLYQFQPVVSIWYNNRHHCGGSLVDDDTVLTAAHCFSSLRNIKTLEVLINAHNFRKPTSLEKRVKVVASYTHPKWNPMTTSYDYHILKLAKRIPVSRTVSYARLPTYQDVDTVLPNDRCHVVGWGSTSVAGFGSHYVLQMGAMRMIDNAECKRRANGMPGFQYIGRHTICARSEYQMTSACRGDSGGPLFCYPRAEGFRRMLVGVVSFGGIPCGQIGRPVAFAKVSHVLNWIRKHF